MFNAARNLGKDNFSRLIFGRTISLLHPDLQCNKILGRTLKKLSNAERLEMENAKMEERLRTLRKTIEKEKQVRRSVS